MTLPHRTTVKVSLFVVTATGGAAPTTAPDNTAIQTYLNDLYGKQANVFFQVWAPTPKTINYDTNPANGMLDLVSPNVLVAPAEFTVISPLTETNADLRVHYVNALTNSVTGSDYKGNTPFANSLFGSFIQDSHPSSVKHITAHELGHQMGIPWDVATSAGPPNRIAGANDRLMWWQAMVDDPCRLIKAEWVKISLYAKPL